MTKFVSELDPLPRCTFLYDFQIFNVKQGWKPLCDFLGVPVPADCPFPNVNDTKSFNVMMKRMKYLGMALVYGVPLAVASVGYLYKDSIMALISL